VVAGRLHLSHEQIRRLRADVDARETWNRPLLDCLAAARRANRTAIVSNTWPATVPVEPVGRYLAELVARDFRASTGPPTSTSNPRIGMRQYLHDAPGLSITRWQLGRSTPWSPAFTW
jgi:hypothetical protein